MQAIQVHYKGFHFRSRLEARWAVFFDALGIEYDYEPEGFEKDGIRYLPDFRVTCHGILHGGRDDAPNTKPFDLFIEVKGAMDEYSAKKIKTFGCNVTYQEAIDKIDKKDYNDLFPINTWEHLGNCKRFLPILVVGGIPYIHDNNPGFCVSNCSLPRRPRHGVECFSTKHIIWCYCDEHGYPLAAFPGIDESGNFVLYTDRTLYNLPILERVMIAYDVARGARFEHGANMERKAEEARDLAAMGLISLPPKKQRPRKRKAKQ